MARKQIPKDLISDFSLISEDFLIAKLSVVMEKYALRFPFEIFRYSGMNF
jgi:hypothetical protein